MSNRCKWCNLNNPLYVKYHDEEWCVPTYDDSIMFEFLVLESFQAGLSWETILNKRENFREAFDGFDPDIIQNYGEDKTKFECDFYNYLKNDSMAINSYMGEYMNQYSWAELTHAYLEKKKL